jgi:hypothetical protein
VVDPQFSLCFSPPKPGSALDDPMGLGGRHASELATL